MQALTGKWIGIMCLAIAVTLITSTGCGLLQRLLCGPPVTTPPAKSNIVLMNEAEQLVQPEYPNSLLIEAHGTPSSGSAEDANDIDQWLFIFVDDMGAANVGTVLLEYVGGEFGDPVHVPQGWVGTVYERLPRVLNLAQAIQKMREAGHIGSFSMVTLRKPLTFPQPEEALYAFSLPGRFVLVGAETGEVSVEIPQAED